MTKEVYIFDIDGCIMPPIVSNFKENTELREKTVNGILNNGHNIKLFPDFIKYYEKRCKHAEAVIFITGRKKSEFSELTETQLKPLKKVRKYKIKYYPENKTHKSNIYFEWKAKKIREIINANFNRKDFEEDYKQNIIFNIFDDMNDYYPKIEGLSKNSRLKINLFLINGEKSWKYLLK